MIGNFLSKSVGTSSICEDLSQRLAGIGYPVIETSSRVGRIARLLDMLTTILTQRRNYDLAYLEVYSGLAFVWAEICAQLLSLLRKPFVLALHGGGLPAFAKKHSARLFKVLSQARLVVTPSLFIQESLSPYCVGIRYLPNAIDLSQYHFRLRERPAPKLIWLRAFHEIYNPEMAVHALSKIRQIAPDATLIMLGPDKSDGSLKRVLELVRERNLDRNVTIRGPIPKSSVPFELNAGDIFINTTRLESFGVSVLEAVACGLPVVTTNVGELSYLWQNEVDALVVSSDNYLEMAGAIQRILTESGLAGRLTLNARGKANQFDWSVVLPQWQDLLQAACGFDGKTG